MSIRCGNCKNLHEKVADVQACFNGDQVESVKRAPRAGNVWPPSEAQIKYVLGLQAERNLPDGYKVHSPESLAEMDKAEVSDIIVLLKSMSKKEGSNTSTEYTMPAARYALQDDNGVWRFYQVDRPTDGRWKGYTFIKRLRGSPGQYQKDPVPPSDRYRLLRIIETNQQEAMTNYGLQSGVCGKCSSPLTDPQSLARGIGPICLSKMGW